MLLLYAKDVLKFVEPADSATQQHQAVISQTLEFTPIILAQHS